MPWKTFNAWLFDGNINSPIPRKDIDILKYNSPITNTYVLSLFLRNGHLNKYLDTFFNNFNLWYISREDMLKFIKKCVHDFRIQKRDLVFYPRKERILLFEKLRERFAELKDNDISLLCEIIDKDSAKDEIYETLGLEKTKKLKAPKKKTESKDKKISLDDFLNDHFSTIKIK